MNNFYREFKPGTTAVNLIDMYGVKIIGKIGTYKSSYVKKTDAITYLKIIKNDVTIHERNLGVNRCINCDEWVSDKLEAVCWLLMENVDTIDIENIMNRLIENRLTLDIHRMKRWKENERKKEEQKALHEKREQNEKEGCILLEKHDLYLFDGVKTSNNGYQTMVLRFHNDKFKKSFLHAYELYKKDSRNKTVGGYMDFLIQYPNTDDAKQIDIVYRSSDLINWNSLDQIKSILLLSQTRRKHDGK